MFLPELNHLSNYRYELGGFGGINRRENASVGELLKAVNLSPDEYPLITTRKRYNIGEFEKFAVMWHNNDRDMALVPALKSETVYKATHVREIDRYVEKAKNGSFGIVYLGEVEEEYRYHDESLGLTSILLIPGKGYNVTKTGTDELTGKMIGSFAEVTETSCIRLGGDVKPIDIPEVVGFKNPVTANIGTSTVICDEINGMWVLEYDKDTDAYTYNKVQNKYEVSNEVGGTSNNPYINGGQYCHVRCWFDDYTLIKDIIIVKTEDELNAAMEKKEADSAALQNVDCLIVYRQGDKSECLYYRLRQEGYLEAVDFLVYEFCTIEGALKFRVGDYVELNMSGIWGVVPDCESDLQRLDGMYDVIKIRENEDDVKYSVMLKGGVDYRAVQTIIKKLGKAQKKDDTNLVNNKYLADGMTIKRKAPENVRFICSYQNRIWANNGDNEIMCCAQGNPYIWYRYEGNALDSWATTIGGDGAFTGCVNYGYPLFFKANRMFRITGSRPSNFGFGEYSIRGIKEGCHNSAVIVNDVLYYQSIDGIYAYAQSTPVCISEKMDAEGWQRGKACRFGDKYYIAVKEGEENKLYLYDTKSGIWLEESYGALPIKYIYPGSYLSGYEDSMTIYVDGENGNYIGYTKGAGEGETESPIEWDFETTDLLAGEIEHKYLKKLYINYRIYPEEYNVINIEVQYDGDGDWHHIAEITPTGGESRSTWYCYPIGNKRLENFKIRARGVGKAVIYKIVLEFEKGS